MKYLKLQQIVLSSLCLLFSINSYAGNPFIPGKTSFSSHIYYSVYIMDNGKSKVDDLASMLQFYNPRIPSERADEMARIYVEESMDEGVNHDIAFCQMILETGYLKYGGDVKSHQNNFCGLGATGNFVAGEHFPDIRTGIRAHIQHLKAYASKDHINKKCVDNRFRYVERGSAKTIYALTGKWATDPHYDIKLENLLERLFSFRKIMANQNSIIEHPH